MLKNKKNQETRGQGQPNNTGRGGKARGNVRNAGANPVKGRGNIRTKDFSWSAQRIHVIVLPKPGGGKQQVTRSKVG